MNHYGLAGYAAGLQGIKPERNPHQPDSEAWRQWEAGNRRAWAEREQSMSRWLLRRERKRA